VPRKRESVGKALRRALGEEVVLPKIEPRSSGVSHLMNQRRLRVYQTVFNEPGIHLRELQRELDIPLQSLRWHVSVLLGAGIIEGVSLGKKTALFTPLSARQEDVIAMTLARDGRFSQIIRMVETESEVSVRELVREIGSYQQLVSARLKTLRSLGFVTSQGKGARIRYRLAATAHPAVGEEERDPKEAKESLIALLTSHGLAPRVTQQSSRGVTIVVETPSGDVEMQFKL